MGGLFGGHNGCGNTHGHMECCDIILLLFILSMCGGGGIGCDCNTMIILLLLLSCGGCNNGCDEGCR